MVCGAGRRRPLSADTVGLGGGTPGGGGGAPPGTRGALGGFDAADPGIAGVLLDGSGSERYGESLTAPVLTPPAFLSFGIPPARIPASCGPPPKASAPPDPASLCALALPASGLGGAPPGGFNDPPGTGGAPRGDGPAAFFSPPTIGADRSFVTVFLSCLPFEISPNKAP